MMTMETRKLEYIRRITSPFVAKVARVELVPWLACAGPSTWAAYGKPALPVFVLELDTRQVSAGKLMKDKNLLHDIATALGGRFQVYWMNSIGLALVIDERPPKQIDLVEALDKSECAMVVGPRGTGKTTLLQHIIQKRGGNIVIFDPKLQTPGKWPDAEIVGAGGDYAAIAERLAEIVRAMENGGYGERVLVVVDELWLTLKSLPVIAPDVWKIVTLGREPMVDIIVGTHSEMVKGLGIEGQGDLRDSFDVVRLKPGFQATFAMAGQEEKEAVHPGPFEATQLARITLTDDEIKLVQWAVYRNGGSFSLGKMEPVCRHTNFTPFGIRRLAEEWEARGWLTEDSRLPNGQRLGRRVTPKLMQLLNESRGRD